MANNFACIGWRTHSRDEFRQATETIFLHAEDRFADGHVVHRVWRDPSGACVAFHVENGKVQCVTPFFDPGSGLARWRVRTAAPTLDAGCEHCSGADCDVLDPGGEMVTRATVQWVLYRPYAKWLREPRSYELEVAAFADTAKFAATEEAFEAAQAEMFPTRDGKPMRLAGQAFMPHGMFGPTDNVRARATALFTGSVEHARRLRNTLSGHDFLHVRVLSYQGQIDVVATTDGLERDPEPGHRALVSAWLVGRPVDPPPAASPSWLKRLFH